MRIRHTYLVMLIAMGMLILAPIARATNTIVIFRPDVVATSKATQYGLIPYQVYSSGFSGFAADIDTVNAKLLAADPDVVMIRADRQRMYMPGAATHHTVGAMSRGFGTVSTNRAASGKTPVEQISQITTRAMKRIGLLESPTAAVDGRGGRANVDIAVIDTGIQSNHPDLNVVGGMNCSSSGRGWSDVEGHGTIVAGVAAAIDNSFGVVGAAPGARLWSVRAFDANNEADDSSILCAINWVTDHAETIDVANLSFTGTGSTDKRCGADNADVIHYAICRSVRKGVTYVAAAGNDGIRLDTVIPASYPEVISASAMVDSDGAPGANGAADLCMGLPDDTFAPFSNYGRQVGLAAPGVCVSSTYIGSDVAVDSGTSYASPAVAGAAALWLTSPAGIAATKDKERSEYPSLVRKALTDARERTQLVNDPDAIPEGIVNVRRF